MGLAQLVERPDKVSGSSSVREKNKNGGLAQLVERLHGMQEVIGSTPLSSTFKRLILIYESAFFYYHFSHKKTNNVVSSFVKASRQVLSGRSSVRPRYPPPLKG